MNDFATILGAVVSATAIVAGVREWWRRTVGRRHHVRRRVEQLCANVALPYFVERLGQPALVLAHDDGLVESIFVDEFCYLASIGKDKRQTFRFPLPPALSATAEWRRLTVTLAWLSQVNTRSQKHRMARLAVQVPRSVLAVEPIEADHNAVLRGTVQHQVLEGQAVVGFLTGSALEISVDCRVDAGTLSAPVRYALVASLEVAASVQTDLHAEVRQGIRTQVQQRLREQVAVR